MDTLSMVDELKKEIESLKNRIAVIESRQVLPVYPGNIIYPTYPNITPYPPNPDYPPYYVTCQSCSASLTDLNKS